MAETMTLGQLRNLLNTLPLAADKELLDIRDEDTQQLFGVVSVFSDRGIPVITVELV